ncbi:MAG: flagellar biosynthetic protein FliO [Chloroflexota bacterium]
MDASLIKAFLTLAGSVAALAAILYLLKRQMRSRGAGSNFVGLKIVGKLDLQAKNKLYVVEAGSKTVLIGVSDKGITALADLTDEQKAQLAERALPAKKAPRPALASAAAKPGFGPSDSLSFSAFLKSAIGKNN